MDDVINVSGHRLSTAEIESALVQHQECAEAAVVGVHDDITGQSILAFCVLKTDASGSGDGDAARLRQMQKELTVQVRKVIGPFAAPKNTIIVSELPKTRSGKIMRRILRKLANGERQVDALGDLSTLSNPSVINNLLSALDGAGVLNTAS